MSKKNQNTVRHSLGNKDGEFKVTFEKDGVKAEKVFNGITLDVPISVEALRDAFSEYKTKIGEVEVTGLEAAGARQFLQMAETVRGALRDRLAKGESLTDEQAQAEFDAWGGPGRSAPRVRKYTEEEIAAAVAEHGGDYMAGLRSLGLMK